MTGFIVGAGLLLLVTVGLLAWPLLRRAAPTSVSTRQLTAAVYRDKLAELDQDLAAGSLAQADYELSRAELQRRLLEDSSAATEAPVTGAAQTLPYSKALLLPLVTVLPVAAVALYVLLGSPAALEGRAHPQRFTQSEIEQMVAGLAAKLEKEPENHKGWAMLGRSYKMMGRFKEAAQAYAKTGPLLDGSAELLVDYADAVAAAANGFNEPALQLLDRALKLDPNNAQGLWMRGSAAFEAQQFDRAIADWDKLLAQLPAGSEDARTLAGNLAEAREKAGQAAGSAGSAGGTRAAAVRPAASAAPAAAAASSASIQGRVELAPELAKAFGPDAVLMIIARPADGTRMPLAVLKQPAAGFPATFMLDDRQSLIAERRLSGFSAVLLEARISRSGQAKAEPGDLAGEGVPVKLGARGVSLRIDRVVK